MHISREEMFMICLLLISVCWRGAGLWKQSGAQKREDAGQIITSRGLTHTESVGWLVLF